MDLAISKDIEEKYIEALALYEVGLNNINPSIDYLINLSFLYWMSAFEYPFIKEYKIPGELSIKGGENYLLTLDRALELFPNNVELHFWKNYFQHIVFDMHFGRIECENLINEYGDQESLVPYFFLYLYDNEKYKEKINSLLKKCEELPTAKNLYIKSIIRER